MEGTKSEGEEFIKAKLKWAADEHKELEGMPPSDLFEALTTLLIHPLGLEHLRLLVC